MLSLFMLYAIGKSIFVAKCKYFIFQKYNTYYIQSHFHIKLPNVYFPNYKNALLF